MDMAAARIKPRELAQLRAAQLPPPGNKPVWSAIHAAADAPSRLGDAWRELAREAAEPNVFAEMWFAEPGLRYLAPPDVRMLEVWRGTGESAVLLGLLPLTAAAKYGRMPVRHVQNWLHFHSFLGTPLIRAGAEQAFWTAALDALDLDPWARGFLHIEGLGEEGPAHRGLKAAAEAMGRPCDTVYREERALLASSLSPEAYYEATVRKKKRKELKRLASRLAELGKVEFRTLGSPGELESWCHAFLALERAGWKGEAGSALGCTPATEAFFCQALAGALASERLDFLRLDLDGRPIAMLVNLLAPPGSFSFKIAYDETYARFSPGVLIQIENLRVLSRGDIDWMDSCAVEDHPMINSLWGERRGIVRVSVPLSGWRRRAMFRLCRLAETASAAIRRARNGASKKGAEDDE
jgi:CelD/BcsL family acetyltransferase involved in cellulose biosynthesis